MSKKILFMSSAKLTAISIGLLLAVFCTIGMSFRPVYDEDEAAEIVMLGQRRNHWTWVESGCLGDTYYYQSSVDYAKTQVQTRGNGSVTLSTSETTNVTSPVSGDPRTVSTTTATGNTVSISWNSGLSEAKTESKPTFTETQITAAHKKTFTITATPINDDYYFAGWGTSTSESSIYSNVNPRVIVSDMQITGYTSTSNAPTDYTNSSSPYTETYYAFFKQRQPVDITLKVPTNGTVSYSYESVPTITLASETTITTKYDLTLSAAPAEGYVFFGWYTMSGSTENYISYANPNTSTYKENTTIYAKFIPAEQAIFSIKGTEQYYYDLNRACTEAASSSSKIVYLAKDGMMPAGNYTIPSGVNLLIPYNLANAYQTLPTVVTTAETLTAYRKLTLTDGVNIVVNNGAQICVGGQIMSAGGGKPSAYPTGACGVIDMSRGGHIELNNGATLYAWGFIKGQDMDQGNNTQNVGSITANSGAVVWEDFAVGDWRGGTACLTIYNNRNSWKFFPFQSYTIQNIEVPTTYKYGSTLSNYTNVYGDGHVNAGQFSIIGNSNTLFLLKDAASLVRKWYDPTTDLVCYEMSGTTQLDALNVDVEIITVSSTEFNLPLSSSMHIILTNCNTTISKPMVVQAGAVVEVKADATLTLSSNVYVFDKDQWGQYCRDKYFYSMANLSIHKDRGAGTSNAGLDDAKLFVNGGTVNITGKLYTTTSGADIMGSDGGKITFSSLPSAGNIVMCTGVSDNENVAVASANLHNENESYTQAKANKTFLNINGRWFNQTDGAAAEKANHTYDFTYISSGAVSGTGGTNTTTDAVYSWDKTGLELRQKWANVTYSCEGKDENENTHYWWQGQGDQSTWFYNWTLNSDWHQFMPTATEGMYSGSNNKIYTKTDCDWGELGETDVNCLYEIGGVKKALVEGQFIALEPNNNDPAYHAADDAAQYYICFEGCNWHAADKYAEAEKAYIIAPDTFIWYNSAWMSVNFQEPFAYTLDATNVPVYYEYTDGEWTLAEPYVRVVDGLEDRPFWFFKDAFKFANSVLRTSPTITILRDISARTAAMSYTAANKTCTLDLNGNKLTLTVVGAGTSAIKMFNINAAGTTFTITDSSEGANGEFRLIAAPNTTTQTKRWYGVYLTNGTLVLNAGKIYAEDNFTYTSTSDAGIVSSVGVAAGMSFTMNDGTIEAYSKYAAYGVDIAGSTSANATVKIKGGTIHAETTQVTTAYGMVVAGGTTTITGGKIEARAKTTTAIGVVVTANANGYYGTLKVEGGEIDALTTTTTCYGVQVGEAIVYSSGNIISNRVKSEATISGGTIRATSTTTKSSSHTVGVRSLGTTNIIGGTIECNATQSIAYGVYAVSGTTTISGTPTIIATAPTNAYGACAGLTPADKTGVPYNGNLVINGGRFDVSATTTTGAYGVLVQALGRAVSYSTKSGYYPGNYVSAGSATINGGEFDVQAHTTTAYGIYVKGAITQTGAKLDADGNLADPVTSNPPTCSVTGGKFKISGTGSVYATNTNALPADFQINGGYYSHDGNLATYVPSPKHVLTLASDDANRPPYYYKVAEAYLVTFKNEDGTANIIDPVYQEVGTTPVCSTEPTKESTSTNSFTFDGWATEANGTKVYEPNGLPNVTSAGATYYAHFATTTLKYRVHFDAATNGGECATENIYVNPSSAISTEIATLPTATKYGYTFNGWYTAASSGTKITTATVPTADVTYYAQFTVNSHTLTWDLAGGTVSTAGKIGSTTWPAKNATGTQSRSVAYGTVLTTIPVVTRTGYTFNRWDPVPGSSMPDADVTYTAIWTPKTNTAYTVKHYQQNVDGTYPTDPFETEAFTGTTATSVTPAVKSYEGFVSPATQTVTIAAAGTTVVEYRYARRHYTFTLDAYTNGGTSDLPSIEVIHGATIGAVPPDAQKGCNDFVGWFTKPDGGVKITSSFVIEYDMKTLYAQFSDGVRTYPITYLAGAHGTGTVAAGTKTCGEDATLSSSTFTRDGYAQTGWSLTDGGAQAYVLGETYTANASLTLYPVWTLVGYQINFVDEDGTTTLGDYPKTLNPGATVTAPTEPTKAQTAEYTYTFAGWSDGTNTYTSDAIPNVTAAATYTATYTATPNVASVTVGGATTYYTTIDAAFEYVNTASANMTIIMLANATAAASLVYQPTSTYTCTLDLNNHTISGSVAKLIDINLAKSTFIITDNSVAKGGKVDNNYNENARAYGVFLTAGTFKLQNGTISSTNPHTYSTASANKNSAASAVYVTAGQTFTMDNGTVESASQYASYAIYMARGTSTVTINNGLVKGRTTKSTTAAGIYNLGKGLTVNGGRIIGHAYTTTAYGIYLYGGSGTIKGGTIEATNDTTSSKGTTTTYGIYVNYYNGTYKGVLTIPSTSTVNVLAKARTTTSYAIVVGGSSTGSTIAGGTFTAKTMTGKTAYAVNSSGNITISGGTFIANSATTNAYGLYSVRGTITVSGNPTFNVTSGTSTAYGALAYGTIGKKGTGKYSGTIKINGGTFNVTSTSTDAYGALAGLASRDLRSCSATNDTVPGLHYMPGILEITNGTFNVKAKTTVAYGVHVTAAKNESGDVGTTTRIPLGTITGGKFKVESMGDANATAYAMTTTTTAARLVVQGGYYSTKAISATANIEDKYTAPEKSCNYWVLPLSDATYHYEVAEAYKVTWDATTNGGSCGTEYTVVKNGAAIGTLPEATKTNYSFDGWYTAAAGGTTVTTTTTISATQTYYAQFTPDSYTVTLNTNGGTINAGEVTSYTYGTGATLPTDVTKDGHTFGGWFDNSGLTGDAVTTISSTATGNKEFWAKWTTAETGDYLDIVDWTASTLTINANGWSAGGWPYTVNDVVYQKDQATAEAISSSNYRAADRTLTIPYSGAAGSELDITVKSGETVISKHTYTIPYINTAAADAFVYVSSGTLSIDASSVSHLATLSIRPEASVTVTNGTLAVDSLVLRTLPWQAASISGDFTATKTYYTRIAPNNRTISGPGGDITYVSANYYQFALPLNCTIPVKDIKVSHGAKTTYGKAWLLKSYSESSRAETGAGDNWVSVGENEYIQGRVGYEMSSNSAYYREFLFPVGAVNSAELGTTTDVSYDLGAKGENHAGWNIVGSPLMSVYDNSSADPETGLKVSWLQTDGSYDQGIPDYIYPAIPFTYQASSGQTQISFAETSLKASAPRRRIPAAEEPERIQWIHLDVKDANGKGDHTSVLSHPTRYEETYKTGIDVAKQSLTAARAILYSSHAYGDMAFAGVSDELFEQGVALTVYSPAAQELTFSLRHNDWLNRLQYVWIIDFETGAMIDLLNSDYTAEVTEGTTYGRFYISGRFRAPQIATDIDEVQGDEVRSTKAQKMLIEEKIYIMVGDKLYDATGKLVKGK